MISLLPNFSVRKPQQKNLSAQSSVRKIGFSSDSFNRNNSVMDRFINGNIDESNISTNSGTNGKVSIIKESDKPPIVIKSSHNTPINPHTGLVQRVGVDFDREAYILSLVPNSVKNTTRLVGTKQQNGINYMAITYLDGKNPYAMDSPSITQKHIKSCLNDLFELDKAGVLHRDLIPENLLVTDDEKINITDYGAGETFKEVSEKQDNPKYNHPENWLFSNMEAFEELFIIPYCRYLSDNKKEEEAKTLFVGFLKQKGDFHAKKAELNEFPEGVDKTNIKNLKHTEEVRSKIFKRVNTDNPEDKLTKDIVELEILRTQINMSQKISRLYDGSGVAKNPLTSLYWQGWSGIVSKQLINKTENLKKEYANDNEMQDFLDTEKDFASSYMEKVSKPGLKNIFGFLYYCMADDKSLIKNDSPYKDYDDPIKREETINNMVNEGIRAPMFNQVEGHKTNNNVQITTIYVPQNGGIFH